MLNKKIIINTFHLFGNQGVNYVFPLIIIPLLITRLGVRDYGILVLVQTTFLYLSIIIDYGFNITSIRDVALNKSKDKIINIVSKVVSIKLLIFFTIVIFYFLINKLILNKFNTDVILCAWLGLFFNIFYLQWLFQGLELMKYINYLNSISKIIIFMGTYYFVKNSEDLYVAVLIPSLANLFLVFTSFFILKKEINISCFKFPSLYSIIEELKLGFNIFLATLFGNIYGQGSLLVIGLVCGPSITAIYSVLQKITGALASLVQPVAQSTYPYICNNIENTRKFYEIKKIFIGLGAIFGLISLLISNLYLYEILTYFKIDLDNIIRITYIILSIGMVFTILNVLLNPILIAKNNLKSIRNVYLNAAIIFIVLSFPLTYYMGSIGMAIVMAIVELSVLTFILVSLNENNPKFKIF